MVTSRLTRRMKIAQTSGAGIETFIERVKKARAVGCNLSYLGIDTENCKKLFSNRISGLIK